MNIKMSIQLVWVLTWSAMLPLTGCLRQPVRAPLASGDVEIVVDYENFSAEDYNRLSGFVNDLPDAYDTLKEGAGRLKMNRNCSSYRGFWGDGNVVVRYGATYAIPEEDVEADLRALLQNWLIENNFDQKNVVLSLRYGEKVSSAPAGPAEVPEGSIHH